MPSVWDKAKHEVRSMLPVALYFVVAFQLLAATQWLLLAGRGADASVFAGALVGALVVAKVVALLDMVAPWGRLAGRHAALRVAVMTVIYFIITTAVRHAEETVRIWLRSDGGLAAAHRRLLAETPWTHALCVHMWLLVLLLVFCAFRELLRAKAGAAHTPPREPRAGDRPVKGPTG